jgi:putative ABC transport system permease protein
MMRDRSLLIASPALDGLLFDLRLAFRGLRRDPGFALTAIATLTVALALNVTVYTIRDAMVVRGLPLAATSERLVYLALRKPADMACCPGPVRYADFEQWRAHAGAFQDAAFGPRREPIAFRADGRQIDTTVSRQTANTFRLLGVPPAIGRDFTAADETPGAPGVAIVSHEFWVGRLGKRADIVGLPVLVDGAPVSIVGVMPERFAIVFPQDLYMPLVAAAALEAGAIARLKDGATLEEARAQLETITSGLQEADGVPRGVPEVHTYAEAYTSPDSPRIYGALWAGAWLVLLIACANLTNLMLVRTIGRWREFSTRIALGAGHARMIRQMLIESLLVTGVGAVAAWWIINWSVATWADATASRYLVLDYSITFGTLIYLVSIAIAAALVIAVLPIARVMRLGVSAAVKGDARGVTQNLRGKHLTATLVATQMALAIVLLLGAGVLVRSFENVVGADTGVLNPEQVMVGLIGLPSDTYPTPAARTEFFSRVEAELRTIAGAEGVSVASTIPTRGLRVRPIEIAGRPAAPDAREVAQLMTVGVDYFRTMGRPTIAGRDFTVNDGASAPPVVLVNQSFADAFWADGQAIGQRVRTVDPGSSGAWRTVVGIVPDIMQGDPTRQTFKPLIYLPFRQQPSARAFIFVRARTPAAQTTRAVLAQVQQLDPDVLTEQFNSLEAAIAFDRDWMDLEHADLGKHAAIAPVFAVVALVLAMLGLVAVIVHSVSQRTKEIGIRMAIGAARRDIARMVMREGMRPVAIGLAVGFLAAAATNRILESQLVGVSPYDPLTFAGGPLVLVGVALMGCRIPVKRATQVDPVVALRHD